MSLRAELEVILAAGAIGSPHLMMLSGLGPAMHLAAHGIEVVADLPAVGQYLEDHLGIGGLSVYLKDPEAVFGVVPARFEDALREFERSATGILATHHLDAGAFYSIDPGRDYPQCQSIMTPGIAEFYRTDGSPDRSRFCLGGCRAVRRAAAPLRWPPTTRSTRR